MRNALIACAVVLSAAPAAYAGAQGESPMGGRVPWSRDIEGGFRQAHSTGKPLALYFTAEW